MGQGASFGDIDILKGEFFTDGSKFVFRLADTPLTGVGETPSAAFADLMRVQDSVATLAQRLKDLARDQQGERVRATIVRAAVTVLIVLGVTAGVLVSAAGMAPRIASRVTTTVVEEFTRSVEGLSPDREKKIADTLRRLLDLRACPGKEETAPGAAR